MSVRAHGHSGDPESRGRLSLRHSFFLLVRREPGFHAEVTLTGMASAVKEELSDRVFGPLESAKTHRPNPNPILNRRQIMLKPTAAFTTKFPKPPTSLY